MVREDSTHKLWFIPNFSPSPPLHGYKSDTLCPLRLKHLHVLHFYTSTRLKTKTIRRHSTRFCTFYTVKNPSAYFRVFRGWKWYNIHKKWSEDGCGRNAFPIGHTLCDQLSWSHYRLLIKWTKMCIVSPKSCQKCAILN